MRNQKKYKVIAKVSSDHFVRYNVNNLLAFALFLDSSFPNWRWFNVYAYTKEGDGQQLDSFTRNKRPARPFL
jgi:hypothetical protein